jgi:hypothetical protein
MHFSLREETIRMVPTWIPDVDRPMIAVVSGMIEVCTGLLLLIPRIRRRAALISLCLLALYIPAVYHILADDSALPGNVVFKTVFRVMLMPNNIFLAICSIHIFQAPNISLTAGRGPETDITTRSAGENAGLATLLVAGLLLMANCAGFIAILVGVPEHFATASLWAMMCIATGALLGFLFGVPRVNPDTKASSYLIPNTNIETVSDWLTKIIVGVGLINLKEIGTFLDGQSTELASALATDKSMALSLIVYFFIVGLIQGYLLTRLFLSWQFAIQAQPFGPPATPVAMDHRSTVIATTATENQSARQ